MALGYYNIADKKIQLFKDAIQDITRHNLPHDIKAEEGKIYIYGNEDEHTLVGKLLKVHGDDRVNVCNLIFSTLMIHHNDVVRKTFDKLKNIDPKTYNTVSSLLETDPQKSISTYNESIPVQNKFCTNCGTKIDSNLKFCTNCGSKITSNHSQPISISNNTTPNNIVVENTKITEIKSKVNNIPEKTTKNETIIFAIAIVILVFGVLIAFNNSSNNVSYSETQEDFQETAIDTTQSNSIYKTLNLINNSTEKISVAIGFSNNGSLGSRGWYNVPSKDSLQLDLLSILEDEKYFKSGDMWFYAESDSWVWDGEKDIDPQFWVTDSEAFTFKHYWNIDKEKNISLKNFFKVYLDGATTNIPFND